MTHKKRENVGLAIKVLVGIAYCMPVLLAFLFSFHTNDEILTIPLKFFTKNLIFDNFKYVFQNVPIFTYLKNTIIMLIIIIPVQVMIGSVTAFAVTFYEFPLRNFLFTFFLTIMVIPSEVNVIANYMTIQSLGLMDTYLGMTITSFVNVSGMFMLRQHMLSLPKSLWEAAKVDGCGEMKYFVQVVLPLSKSIIAAQVLNSFIFIYNAYLWPLLVTSTENMRTIQTGIANLARDLYWNPGGALAGAIICMVIPVIVYIIGLDQIVGGLTSGAVKN